MWPGDWMALFVRRPCPWATASLVLLALQPQSAKAESLMELVAQAQVGDPEFQEARYQNKADAEATAQAWAKFQPSVRLSGGADFTGQDVLSSNNPLYPVGSKTYPDYSYDVTLEQSLFKYSDWANLKAAKALARQGSARFEAAKQDLLLRVAERYFALLSAVETADAAQAEARALKEHFELMQARFSRGGVRNAEVLDAAARSLQAQARQQQADAAVRDALSAIKQVTGASPASLATLSDLMPIKSLNPADPQHWIDMARANNPRIKAAIQAAERGRQEVEERRAEAYPSISLQVFQDRRKALGSLFGGGSDIEEYGARLKVDVPLYDGGAGASHRREAGAMYSAARAAEVKVRRDVEHEVEIAADGVDTAAGRTTAFSAALRAQAEVARQLAEAFKSGVASSVDVLDSQRDLFLARAEYTRARYDYVLAALRLRHAVGMLGMSDLEEVDRLLIASVVKAADYGAAPSQTPSTLPFPQSAKAAPRDQPKL